MNLTSSITVLALNANWQVCDAFTPAKALSMLFSGVAKAVDIQEDGTMTPMEWDAWAATSPRDGDDVVHTTKTVVRVPRVVIAVNHRRLHVSDAPFTLETQARRQGYKCAYSNRPVDRRTWSFDHVIPKSRGGSNRPDNLVVAHKDVNNRKADRTPEEAGMQLLIKPRPMPKVTPAMKVRAAHGVRFPEWAPFMEC